MGNTRVHFIAIGGAVMHNLALALHHIKLQDRTMKFLNLLKQGFQHTISFRRKWDGSQKK